MSKLDFLPIENVDNYGKSFVKVYDYCVSNPDQDYQGMARFLFNALRYLDEEVCVDYIFVHGTPESEIGAAIMNRIRKAAFLTLQ